LGRALGTGDERGQQGSTFGTEKGGRFCEGRVSSFHRSALLELQDVYVVVSSQLACNLWLGGIEDAGPRTIIRRIQPTARRLASEARRR